MTPQIARLHARVLPVFWPYLWLQLRWIFKRQNAELRTLPIARWSHVHIVRVGSSWPAYRKPAGDRASSDEPVWESAIPPNLVGVFLEVSNGIILSCLRGFEGSEIAPRFPRDGPGGAEGEAPQADTSWP